MKNRVFLVALALALAAPPSGVLAQAPAPVSAEATVLDSLFVELRRAPDEATARKIAERIWRAWTQPADAELKDRMAEVIAGGGLSGPAAQLPLLDALVADYPDYAEGWNQRATARFLTGDNEGSLADIERTLALEPRHFGALAGRALILHGMGRMDEALEAVKAALDIHPFLPERALFPELGAPPVTS